MLEDTPVSPTPRTRTEGPRERSKNIIVFSIRSRQILLAFSIIIRSIASSIFRTLRFAMLLIMFC